MKAAPPDIVNIRDTNGISWITREKNEIKRLADRLDKTTNAFKLETQAREDKSADEQPRWIQAWNSKSFKYLRSSICDYGSKSEILYAQTTAVGTKLQLLWKDKIIRFFSKIKLVYTPWKWDVTATYWLYLDHIILRKFANKSRIPLVLMMAF